MDHQTKQFRQQLREQMKAERLKLSPQQHSFAAKHIIPQALAYVEQYQAQHIAVYLPFNHEFSLLPLIKELLKQGKKLYLPLLHPFSKGNLLFQAYDYHTPLKKHAFGMYEPKLNVQNVIPLCEIDLIFTPLLACDKQKNRLGYGGGFYDRTLAQATNAVSIGVAYPCQLIEQVPMEPWDKQLDHLIIGETQ